MSETGPVLIGTRASALAMAQTAIVRDALGAIGVDSEILQVTTDGDVRAPDTAWGEGAFVTAIEAALLDGRIDVAIHSAKDVPTDEDPRLTIAAYLPREDPRDVLVVARPGAASAAAEATGSDFDALPIGARVGTDSPRRSAFLLAARPDLQVHPIHGNVDTRLRRLDEGQTDALVLAAAGLNRLGLAGRIERHLDATSIPPAPGQGALAVQVRSDDPEALELIARLDDRPTRRAVELERAILARSGGGCRAPLGALAVADGAGIAVTAGYASADGHLAIVATRRAVDDAIDGLAASIVDELAERAVEAARASAAPRVLVTRAADRSSATALALVDRGFAPLIVPCIAISLGSGAGLDAAIEGLADVDWVVFTSVNAVRSVVAAADRLGVRLTAAGPGRPCWAAIGRTTAEAMRTAGIPVDLRPLRANGESLAESLPIEPGTRVLLPRGDLADDVLPEALAGRGALVTEVVAYRTKEAPAESIALLEAALAEAPVAILATSGSTVRGLVALSEEIEKEDVVRAIPVIAIGSGSAAEAARLGFTVAAEATNQGPGGLADAVAAAVRSAAVVR